MNTKKISKSFVWSLLMVLTGLTANAQFEQKFTMQFSGGVSFITSSHPVKPEHYLTEEIYGSGMLLNGGLQYNFNRSFSLIGLLIYGTYPTTEESMQDGKYYFLGLGVSAKYKLFPTSKLRPYALGGFSMCFVEEKITTNSGENIEYTQPTLPGLVTGLGVEFDISENLTWFAQSGFNKVLPKENDGLPPTESAYVIMGLNINIFKSKSL